MNGLYGTVRPALVTTRDIDIQYQYRPTRGEAPGEFQPLDSQVLQRTTDSKGGQITGLYNLSLPVAQFNKKGIYSIYIRPKEVETTIWDVGMLAADSSVIGIVFRIDSIEELRDANGQLDLSGYRVEYYDDNNVMTGMSRLITASYECQQVRTFVGDGFPKTIRYNLTSTNSDGIIFCTITPSSATSYKPNSLPSPGKINQRVKIVNTKFNPVLLELELVEHDADTISTMLSGDQIRNLDKGLITTYQDGEIYQQHEYYTLKSHNGEPLYDVKVKRTNIDQTEIYKNIVQQ